jgi:hypothetical protein
MLLNKNSFHYFLLLASGLSALYFLYFPRECSGYAGIYPFLISVAAFIIFLFMNVARLFLIRSDKRLAHKLIPFTILTILLVFYGVIPRMIYSRISGNKILTAWTAQCSCGDLSMLTLMDNGYYKINMTETEFVCRYTGIYKIKGDTLSLRSNIVTETDSTFFPIYIIDFQDSVLRPVINGKTMQNSSRFLKLSLMNLKSIPAEGITSR